MRVLIILSLVCLSQAVQLSSVFSSSEQENAKNLFQTTPYKDVAHAHYSVLGLKALSQGGAVPAAVAKAACDSAKSANTKNLESVFYASSVVSTLGSSCKHEFPAAALDSVTKKIVDGVDVKSLYYAVSVLSNLGKKFSSTDVLALLTKALAEDDSVFASSLGILIATKLDADIKPLLAKSLDVEDMVNQADEIDEKYLHFESDLHTTSTFIRAAFELVKTKKQPLKITEDQLIMLSNYILRSKSLSTFEQAYNVVAPLSAIISSQSKLAKVQIVSGGTVSQDKSTIKISVTNVLDQPIEGLTVKADSVTRTSDNEVVISNVPLKKSVAASVTTYNLNLWDLKPKSGFYDITLNVIATGGASLIGASDVEFSVKVTTKIDILDSQIGTQERESATGGDWEKIKFPKKAPKMKADSQQKVLMTFKVQDTMDKTLIKPHQVFVLFQNIKSGQEIIFIAEPDAQSHYKFEVDLNAASKDQFAGKDGEYSVHLIIGDASISNPILWHMTDIVLTFAGASPASPKESIYKAKPEISHLFRESEKRPPALVSTAFTFACLAPLLILVVSWLKAGVNLSNLSLAPKNLLFHGGLASIFVLYYFFWVQLNMFTTLRYLLLLGSITFLAGSKVLSDQSEQ